MMRSSIAPAKDVQTVTPDGAPVASLIDGVIAHYIRPQEDERGEAELMNFPTCRYDYADPDKYRLPLHNDLIPFDFSDDGGR